MGKAKQADRAKQNKLLLAELRRQIAIGTRQADRGEFLDGEMVFKRLLEKSRK